MRSKPTQDRTPSSQTELQKAESSARHLLALYENELAARVMAVGRGQRIYAVDFDIICSYLSPANTSPKLTITSAAAIEALKESAEIRFTLPPGAVTEFISFCGKWASQLPPTPSRDEFVSKLRRKLAGSPLATRELDKALRTELVRHTNEISDAIRFAERFQSLLNSENLVRLSDYGFRTSYSYANQRLTKELLDFLRTARPKRTMPNVIDSVNLATILSALEENVIVYLVTATNSVHRAYALARGESVFKSVIPQLVIPPVNVVRTYAFEHRVNAG